MSPTTAMDEFRSVEILRLMPGDRLVLTTSEALDPDMAERIRTTLAGEFPGHRVVVLDNRFRFEIIRAEDDPQ